MTQGFVVDPVGNTITFNAPPPVGVNNIVVNETATADVNATDAWAFGAWNPGFGYPAEVEFFSGRLWLACTYAQPETLWASKTDQYNQFGRSVPLLDSDSITMTIGAKKVQKIRDLLPLSDLIIMTSSGEWKLTTGADEIVGPGKNGFKPQTFNGIGDLPGLVIGDAALFVQRAGNIVRDTSFQFTDDKYKGNDLTIYANHLVEDYEIVDIAYQQAPYSAVYLVRSDGALITITYVREQEVVGFALQSTRGTIKRVCVVPEGGADGVYVGVERVVDGVTRSHLERIASRVFTDARDSFFVDSGVTFDGRAQAGTQTLTGGTNWYSDEALTLTGSVGFWVGAGDVGDQVRLRITTTEYDETGAAIDTIASLRVEVIDTPASPTVATVRALETVPAAFRGVAITDWEILRDTLSGLDHLIGETVAILADGFVQEQQVVSETGGIVLSSPAAVVHVGLPYRSLIESLDVNVPGNETVRERPKNIGKVTALVKDSRGFKAGPDEDTLYEAKVREFEDYEDPIALASGLVDIAVSSTWDKNGRYVIVQDDPLPLTLLSLIPDVTISGVG